MFRNCVFSSAWAFQEFCARHESYSDSIGERIWRSGRSDDQAFGTEGKHRDIKTSYLKVVVSSATCSVWRHVGVDENY